MQPPYDTAFPQVRIYASSYAGVELNDKASIGELKQRQHDSFLST